MMKKCFSLLFLVTIIFSCTENKKNWFKQNSEIKVSQKGNISIYYSMKNGLLDDSLFVIKGIDTVKMKQVWDNGILMETYINGSNKKLVNIKYGNLTKEFKGYETSNGDQYMTIYFPQLDSFFIEKAKISVVKNEKGLGLNIMNVPYEIYDLVMTNSRVHFISENHFQSETVKLGSSKVWLVSKRFDYQSKKVLIK